MDKVTKLKKLSPHNLDSEKAVRVAAAQVRAGIVLIYTLDTEFRIEGEHEALGALTLGILPNKKAE